MPNTPMFRRMLKGSQRLRCGRLCVCQTWHGKKRFRLLNAMPAMVSLTFPGQRGPPIYRKPISRLFRVRKGAEPFPLEDEAAKFMSSQAWKTAVREHFAKPVSGEEHALLFST